MPLFRRVLPLSILTIGAFVASASAGLEFRTTPSTTTVSQGGFGSFDIVLSNTSISTIHGASTYDLFVNLTGSGVTLLTETMSTAGLGYVFVQPLVNVPGFGPFVISSTATDFHVGDSEFAAPGERLIGPGQTYGLVHVTFQVAANAPLGDVHINIDALSQVVDAADEDQGAVGVGGKITVVSAVPEPSGLALAAAAVAFTLVARRRARA